MNEEDLPESTGRKEIGMDNDDGAENKGNNHFVSGEKEICQQTLSQKKDSKKANIK
jgi:hypothetical protein